VLLGVGAVGCGPAVGAGPPRAASPDGGAVVGPDLSALTERVRPATVLVANLSVATGTPRRREGPQLVLEGAGSGFVYDPGGYVITNDHVVAGAQEIAVVLPPPDRRVLRAALVGRDPQTDVAVLKVDAPQLPVVPLGKSADLRVGQWVVAVGNALTLPGGPTVSAGIVSALDRHVEAPSRLIVAGGVPGPRLHGLIQTDAAINHGNSGGPLFNLQGEVVGVNVMTQVGAQSVGYAIAIDTARPIVERLRAHGKITRGYLGVDTATATPALALLHRLPRAEGVLLEWVDPGGPAAAAGLREGDVVFAVGGVPVRRVGDIGDAVTYRLGPGDAVDVRFDRGGGEQSVTVTLGEKPPPYGGPI
jgi:S1-C subfamily serine protease